MSNGVELEETQTGALNWSFTHVVQRRGLISVLFFLFLKGKEHSLVLATVLKHTGQSKCLVY